MAEHKIEIVKISVTAHPKADKLELAHIFGWQCVVGKDQFKTDDLAVYFPVDSVWITAEKAVEDIGETPASYLSKLRLKSIRLRGEISQGLLISVPEGKNWKEGKDVTDCFSATKYVQPPERGSGQNVVRFRKRNPNFAKYTDIENIKRYHDSIPTGTPVRITRKIHGQNFRAGWVKKGTNVKGWWAMFKLKLSNLFGGEYEWCVGSHNMRVNEDSTGYHARASRMLGLKEKLVKHKGLVVYGEVYGPKLQDITYGVNQGEIGARIFDIRNVELLKENEAGNDYFSTKEFDSLCAELELPQVPILFEGKYKGISQVKKQADSRTSFDTDEIIEGAVVEAAEPDHSWSPGKGRLKYKYITDAYYLRKNGTEFK